MESQPGSGCLSFLTVIFVALGFGWFGLGGEEEAMPEAPCTASLGIARDLRSCVAVVHASPDAPAVDVFLNGERVVADLAYGQATAFQRVVAGSYRVQIAPAGFEPEDAIIDEPNVSFVAARAYEIAAVGPLAEIAARVNEVNTYALTQPDVPELEPARVRVVHAVPDGPAVDVALIGDDIAERVATALPAGTTSDYLDKIAGVYGLAVTTSDSGIALAEEATVALPADSAVSLYLAGPDADGELTVIPVAAVVSALSAPATPEARR